MPFSLTVAPSRSEVTTQRGKDRQGNCQLAKGHLKALAKIPIHPSALLTFSKEFKGKTEEKIFRGN